MEKINCGSLRFMAPELIKGNMESTTKIDIWSLGLMLHGLVLGFLPFNSQDVKELERQINQNELEYKQLKKLKNSTIKDSLRSTLNLMLKEVSDDFIDLVENMLNKNPAQRFDKY